MKRKRQKAINIIEVENLEALEQEVNKLVSKLEQVKGEIHKVIIGQDKVIQELLIGLLAQGHVLIEGMPGLAKTLLIKTLAEVLELSYRRIQFTPDLMPTDILGTEIIEEDQSGHKTFVYKKGPIFANVVLADEINRTPPKTQAALLEAMQEYKVTNSGNDHLLPSPFFLLATQNPIEQSGTFSLPEAQTDRFLLFVMIRYPSSDEEREILKHTTGGKKARPVQILNAEEILRLQELVREVSIDESLVFMISDLVRETRPESTTVKVSQEYLTFGAGPRAGQAIILASKAQALLSGRYAVIPSDIKKVIHPALRHRLTLNFKAESERLTPDDILDELLTDSRFQALL